MRRVRVRSPATRRWSALADSITELFNQTLEQNPRLGARRTDALRSADLLLRGRERGPARHGRSARGELRVAADEGRVAPVRLDQILVAAGFHDPAVIDHDYLVGIANGRQAVGDRDGGAALGEAVERLLHEPLGPGVKRARGLVEHQNGWVAQDRPGDRDPL